MMPNRLDKHVDGSGECADIRAQLGIYVFAAITPGDRATVVRHLATCPVCRDELVGLAALPGLLIRPAAVAAAFGDDPAVAPGPVLLDRTLVSISLQRRRRRRRAALAATALAAAAVAGWATYLAVPPAPGPAAPGTVLEAERIGGVTVLTDAAGDTLYWFTPDTATRSDCAARCARSWPPVTGPVLAGPGVNGAIGAITRPGGSVQATYDGHPLYTASADTAPGQARGNGVYSDGGIWHEMTVSGALPAAGPPASRPSRRGELLTGSHMPCRPIRLPTV
ncbi:MAG TPA: zf-HC2 domain-containing protein [Streptosporangiaceae bacterium]|nr:zf-HC2 domain-containing protein [Streptosporangiaceae bacterium]